LFIPGLARSNQVKYEVLELATAAGVTAVDATPPLAPNAFTAWTLKVYETPGESPPKLVAVAGGVTLRG
jgi:hypothetical protein